MVLKMGKAVVKWRWRGAWEGAPHVGSRKQVGAHRECAELVQDDWSEHGMGRNGSRKRFLKNIADNA